MIAQIMRDSPADIDGRLKVGDQILEVSGLIFMSYLSTSQFPMSEILK